MNNSNSTEYYPNIADIIYGNYIRYDRLFEMTKFAFYGKTDSNDVNIYIDVYSILKGLYTRGSNIVINDSCVISSCIINLAIHLRAYFDTRHRVNSKIYIVYGGARPINAISQFGQYNIRNIEMEESNFYMKKLILDNMELVKILSPYLHDIFCVVDINNEFSVIVSSLIDADNCKAPNIIYSKEPLSYQLVAFKPYTFLYRPKKKSREDCSWVVTKSTLYDAYRYGELGINKQINTSLDVRMFSIYQSIAGLKSRSMPSIKNANNTIKLLENAIQNNIFSNGYNAGSILGNISSPIDILFSDSTISLEVKQRFASIDLQHQTMLYKLTPDFIGATSGIINLYDPQEVRNINDKYFRMYPLDLNRV